MSTLQEEVKALNKQSCYKCHIVHPMCTAGTCTINIQCDNRFYDWFGMGFKVIDKCESKLSASYEYNKNKVNKNVCKECYEIYKSQKLFNEIDWNKL